ncbi:hypothetical protein ColLi_09223 [Colletotrichum liriopes]|uniref:PD-(D/E)XK nuclease-like domain-containing protein n=1 Tax=Colletotrichum liriopes TaxID=708192 RepID=A0AA37GTB3_9PEZI|nr:hypothetical protein ColLi_09223 [Colletotrichum liriopes]
MTSFSPSSQIPKKFKPLSAPFKMVDYCFIVRLDCDTPDYSRPVNSRSREEWDKAILQLETWLSAQWRNLDDLGWKPTSAIQLLPGIFVQGHHWHFVAALRHGSQVTLISDVYIGGTADHYGVYQIATSLQVLARWSCRVY